MTDQLPRRPETTLALHGMAGLGGQVAPIRGHGLRRKVPREYRGQVRHAAAPGARAIDVFLGLEGDTLPEHFQGADQAQRDRVRIQVSLSALADQATNELVHQDREAFVLLAADLLVFAPCGRLAPERVPDRNLARAGDRRVQIQLDQFLQRLDRRIAQPPHGFEHLLLEFRRQKTQRSHQHRAFGLEVESHDARRQSGDGDHLFYRGLRRTVKMQRGDARIDEALPLPAGGQSLARAAGRRRGALRFPGAHRPGKPRADLA